MSKQFINEIKRATNAVQIKEDKKSKSVDILVYMQTTKDRNTAYDKLLRYFKSKKVKYSEKSSSKSSLGVLNVDGYDGDIIFKPLKRKGSGGEAFEVQLVDDLNAYFGGETLDKLQHGDTITLIKKVTKLRLSKGLEAKGLGKQNARRTPAFNGTQFTVQNNTAGVPVDVQILRNGTVLYNASLKFTGAFYIYQGAVDSFFKDPATMKNINEFFGFDGQQMGKGFGKEYFVITDERKPSKVKANLASIIAQGLGDTMLLVNKVSKGRNYVHYVTGKNHKVSIGNISDDVYTYPVKGQRKYANIKVDAVVNGDSYQVEFQFRGTTPSDKGPRYMRVNLKHK